MIVDNIPNSLGWQVFVVLSTAWFLFRCEQIWHLTISALNLFAQNKFSERSGLIVNCRRKSALMTSVRRFVNSLTSLSLRTNLDKWSSAFCICFEVKHFWSDHSLIAGFSKFLKRRVVGGGLATTCCRPRPPAARLHVRLPSEPPTRIFSFSSPFLIWRLHKIAVFVASKDDERTSCFKFKFMIVSQQREVYRTLISQCIRNSGITTLT